MSPSYEVYLLALLPAVLWGFGPIFDKRGMSSGGSSLQAALVVVLVDTPLYWGVLIIQSWPNLFAGLTPQIISLFAIAGLFGTALGRLFVFVGVKRVGASVNSAAISTRPLFATLLAVLFLSERPGIVTVFGIFILVSGLVVLTYSEGGDISGWRRRDILLPITAAAVFALGNVIRRFGFLETGATPVQAVAINELAALLMLAGFAFARRRRDVLTAPRVSYLYFVGSGLLTAIALLSFFAAFSLEAGQVTIVDPLVSTAPLFTIVFSVLFLRNVEKVTKKAAAGALLVVVGAILISV